jgi:hypothetical protein
LLKALINLNFAGIDDYLSTRILFIPYKTNTIGYYSIPYEVLVRQQGLCAGTAASCATWLNAFVAAGAQTLVLRFGSPDQFGQLERCVKDVLPQVRAR